MTTLIPGKWSYRSINTDGYTTFYYIQDSGTQTDKEVEIYLCLPYCCVRRVVGEDCAIYFLTSDAGFMYQYPNEAIFSGRQDLKCSFSGGNPLCATRLRSHTNIRIHFKIISFQIFFCFLLVSPETVFVHLQSMHFIFLYIRGKRKKNIYLRIFTMLIFLFSNLVHVE